jgi:hypothetical protein
MAGWLRAVFGDRRLGRWAAVLALVIGAVSVLGLGPASARITCSGSGPVDHFAFTLPTGSPFAATAGTPFTATVSALNHCNNVVTSFAGSGTLTSNLGNSPNTSAPTVPSPISFSNGVSSPQVTAVAALTTPTATLTFTAEGFAPVTSAGFTVNPGPPDNLAFTQQPNSGGSSTWLLKTGTSLTTFGTQATIYDAFGNVATQENGPSKVSLSLVQPSGGTATLGPAASSSVAPSSGVATFSGLTVDTSNLGYKLNAAYKSGVTGATSASFDILVTRKSCNGNCSTDTAPVGVGEIEQATGSGNFTFLAVAGNYLGPKPDGCQNFSQLDGQVPIVVLEQRTELSGELIAAVGLKISAIKKKFGSNSGQPFVPICVGTKRLTLVSDDSGTHTQAVPCNQPYGTTEQATVANPYHTGWSGKHLTSGFFDSTLQQAKCDSQSGYFFGIVGSFQDYTNADKSRVIDPNNNPTVTGWTTDATNTYRVFTIRFPSSSTPPDAPGSFANVPWDGWNF